ncbi:chromosome segregation ATPase [Elusimicrobium posterum]|uniref:hypothetical protein n=1 Tax=Elusimicrobium posterum TaxID=3116653 RepID=UPI003C7404A5
MQEKIRQLEVLVGQVTSKLEMLERENGTLKNRLRTLDGHVERLRAVEEEARSLRDWKKDTISQLKKLQTKIEKELKD